MDRQILLHQAGAAVAAIKDAKTPYEAHHARADGFKALGELEQAVAGDAALAAFKNAKPQNSFGVYNKGTPVNDHPVFLVAGDGMKIVSAITLPDGSTAIPNAAGQIAVAMRFAAALIASRGFVRANSVTTDLNITAPDPARNI